jgi:hypothetical protein
MYPAGGRTKWGANGDKGDRERWDGKSRKPVDSVSQAQCCGHYGREGVADSFTLKTILSGI